MEFKTSASIISYVSKIEKDVAALYEAQALRFENFKERFLSYAKENKQIEKNIRRAYYNIVSDALETNFSFKGLTDDVIVPVLAPGITFSEVVKESIQMEKGISAFYEKAAQLSMNLMADLTRALERAAKMHRRRIEAFEAAKI